MQAGVFVALDMAEQQVQNLAESWKFMRLLFGHYAADKCLRAMLEEMSKKCLLFYPVEVTERYAKRLMEELPSSLL